jgi:hypothetical protein
MSELLTVSVSEASRFRPCWNAAIETQKTVENPTSNTMRITAGILSALVATLLLSPERVSAYYDPGVQRWLNRDPLAETDGLNLFNFAGNEPVSAVDTDGLSVWKNTVRVCKQSGKLIKQIRERRFEKAMQMTKESLQDLERHGEHHPVVHVPGDPSARDQTARALSDDGRLRGPEQHGQYPPHFHPNDGPFVHTHVQDVHPHFPWGGALGATFLGIFAPTATEGADSGDNGYLLLGAAWDALTWADPVGVTDLMECLCN